MADIVVQALEQVAFFVNGVVDPLLLQFFGVDAANFDSRPVIQWTQEHTEVPIFFVFAYLAIIFQGPATLANVPPLKNKSIMGLWNVLLSVFSFVGLVNTVPRLISTLAKEGFTYTVCEHPEKWYLDGHAGLYVFLFIYSKIPELMDTVFLVLKKRPVIFLHWFHHCTVLLYCWHAYSFAIAPGIWFAGMNYTVHSIMYMYYGLTSLGLLKFLTSLIAPYITTIQIVQMIVGMAVTVASALKHIEGGNDACWVNPANYKMGFAMYATYFVLFAILFKNLYCAGGRKAKKTEKSSDFCGVGKTGDAAGHFRSGHDDAKKNE